MVPSDLQNIVRDGRAFYGTHVFSGPVGVLHIDNSNQVVITRVTLKAFADLPAAKKFSDFADVTAATWHQLSVISPLGTNVFQHRWPLFLATSGAGTQYLLPKGEKSWDVYLNATGEVIFELLNVGRLMTSATIGFTTAGLPVEIHKPNYHQPPVNYGVQGTGGTLSTLETITWSPGGVATWQHRPKNFYTPANPATANFDSRVNLSMPVVNNVTAISQPQPTIEFGAYTYPVIEVEYVVILEQPSNKVKGPVQN